MDFTQYDGKMEGEVQGTNWPATPNHENYRWKSAPRLGYTVSAYVFK